MSAYNNERSIHTVGVNDRALLSGSKMFLTAEFVYHENHQRNATIKRTRRQANLRKHLYQDEWIDCRLCNDAISAPGVIVMKE
jgi:hypothetical protein